LPPSLRILRPLLGLLAEGEPAGFFGGPNLIMIAAIVAIMYLLVIRPAARREREREAMLQKLKKNDRVVTQGGLHGVVARVEGEEVILKVDLDKKVQVKFSRSAISAILESAPDGDDKGDKKDGGKDGKDAKSSTG
jgi:preprotein translocase subunit YajC